MWAREALGLLDGHGTREPQRGVRYRGTQKPRGAARGGGGENRHVSPGPARYVSFVLPSQPPLGALAFTVRHRGWAPAWLGGPGSAVVVAKAGEPSSRLTLPDLVRSDG